MSDKDPKESWLKKISNSKPRKQDEDFGTELTDLKIKKSLFATKDQQTNPVAPPSSDTFDEPIAGQAVSSSETPIPQKLLNHQKNLIYPT
ncbi:MAG: hypothetical protein QM752_02160 [Gammaproteobacteria bacterium]